MSVAVTIYLSIMLQVLGSCIPDAVGPVVIATELGEPLDSVQLLQLTWQERIKVIQNIW